MKKIRKERPTFVGMGARVMENDFSKRRDRNSRAEKAFKYELKKLCY